METRRSFCRLCVASCGIEVDVEEGRVQAVRGDRQHAMSRGYTCEKGRQLAHQVHHPERLRGSLRRTPAGDWQPLPPAAALDEIAEQLARIRTRHGPHAIASYCATAAYASAPAIPVSRAFHAALGSRSRYTSLTIDQASKIIAVMRAGTWGGGPHSFASADVVMLIGNNPFVSGLHQLGGPPGFRPTALREAVQRGLVLICVDPRRSEVARLAKLHLAIRPGEDAALLSGMLHWILAEGRHDRDFCNAHVDGLEALRQAVAPFTPEVAARRAGIPRAQLEQAASLFSAGPRGVASSGTGPDMGPHPHLCEQLLMALNTVCGRWSREGERVGSPSVLTPPLPRPAQAIPPELLPPELNDAANPERSRIGGVRQVYGEMPTGVLADEILTPGEDQVRALLVVGGNPLAAWPDPRRSLEALRSLELLVCMDLVPTESTRHAHFVVGAAHALERADLSVYQDMLWEEPFAQYSEPVLPRAGEVLEEWQLFAGLARRLGLVLELPGGPLADEHADTLDVLARLFPHAKIPVREIARHVGGRVFDEVDVRVGPPIEGLAGRLRIAPPELARELSAVAAEPVAGSGGLGDGRPFTHLLSCRRLKHVANSVGHDFPRSRARGAYNPAFLHPDDLRALGVQAGELVRIESEVGCIAAVAAADNDLRPGVVSLAHGFGRPDPDADPRQVGSSTSQLVSAHAPFDRLIAMPRFSAVPVRVSAAE